MLIRNVSFLLIVFMVLSWSASGQIQSSADSLASHMQTQTLANSREATFLTHVLSEQRNYRAHLETLTKNTFWLISIVLGFAAGAAIFLLFKSMKEIREQTTRIIRKEGAAALEKRMQAFADQQLAPLRSELALLLKFQKSRIAFVGQAGYANELLQFVLPILHKSSIQYTTRVEEVETFDAKSADVVVFFHKGESAEVDPDLRLLLNRTKVLGLPIVIYTSEKYYLNKQEQDLLDDYQWYLYANMPLTLLSHIAGAARHFNSFAA